MSAEAREVIAAALKDWLVNCDGAAMEALRAIYLLPTMDRLALARALVADMPGVVCGMVPEGDIAPDEEYGLTEFREGRRVGFNAAIAAMLANGEKNDGR